VGTNGFCIPFGQTVAVAIGAGMKGVKWNWRILCEPDDSHKAGSLTIQVGLGIVPSIVQLCLFHFLPESPRVLILRGQDDRAQAVLAKIYPHATPQILELKLRVIKHHIEATTALQRSTPLKQRITKVWTHKPYRRSIFTVCLIQVFGQFTGYNTVSLALLRNVD
jgi:SP family myo-inositol transporter-like MFS transporter 13